ncbi:MAG TPA: 3-phosphoserine/phosphohydroxythreonine transaminase, partial [bacterium]|nr:3-phosphoserine/phosphohydroxythreonine transaminase [bacterium]
MTHRVFNFSPGPATLPLPVMQRVQEEFLDFQGMGASIVEISHRSPEFEALLGETDRLLREALEVPPGYKILYCHGGGQMQFSMVPLNLMGLKPAHKALYVDTGNFAARAAEEGARYGTAVVVASSKPSRYDHIPALDAAALDPEASYLHITTNNTVEGTRWQQFPRINGIPLVGDATSEILGRVIDVGQFGLLYAAAQKNLGPPGLAVVLIREELLGHAHPLTPKLLDYTRLAREHSLTNTLNTFAVYTTKLVLEWLQAQGGVAAME